MNTSYFKDFDSWNEHVKFLNQKKFEGVIHPREIWWCALGVNVGSEQDGKNDLYERPVLILRYMRTNDLVLIAPITSKILDKEDRISFYSQRLEQQILLSQIRTVSRKRLLRKVGRLSIPKFQRSLIKLATIILESSVDDETPPDGGESRMPEGSRNTIVAK